MNKFVILAAWCLLIRLSFGEELPAEMKVSRQAYDEAVAEIEDSYRAELGKLKTRYFRALGGIESKMQEQGDLAGVMAVRTEKENVAKDQVRELSERDEVVVQTREIYLKNFDQLKSVRNQKLAGKVKVYLNLLEGQITSYTKSGRVDDALLATKEKKKLETLQKLPPDAGEKGLEVERLVSIPTGQAEVNAAPFESLHWENSLAISAGKYRLRDPITIGQHGGDQMLTHMQAGGEFVGGRGKFNLMGGSLLAEKCHFKGVPFRGDHTAKFYFISSYLEGCGIKEEGPWHGNGSKYDSKWYFENCNISDSFHDGLSYQVNYVGLAMSRCTITQVELPNILFNKREPATLRADNWFRVEACRFEKCQIPLSFLLTTTDCAFVDCRFVDDLNAQSYEKPVKIEIYTSECTNKIRKAPSSVQIIEIPLAQSTVPSGSVLADEK